MKENLFLEQKIRELCNVASDDGRERKLRLLANQMQEKERECKVLLKENQDLRDQLHSIEDYFASRQAGSSPPPRVPKRILDVWRQLDKVENELKHANNLLDAQTAKNQQLSKEFQEQHNLASERLERIRNLESKLETEASQESEPTLLEVNLHSASLPGLPDDAKSFALVSFQPYGAELSDIKTGPDPHYRLTLDYQLERDVPPQAGQASSISIEVYLLLNERSPRLHA